MEPTGKRRPGRRAVVRAGCGTAGVGVVAAAAAALPGAGGMAVGTMTVSALLTLAATGWWPRDARRLALTAVAVAAVCGLGTVFAGPGATTEGSPAIKLALVEYASGTWLVLLVTRALPLRRSAALWLVLGVAVATLLLRADAYDGALEAAGQSVFLSAGPLAAGALGNGLYTAGERRARSVREARRAQRLELAADLHDFVAHDVSGIVALAQAAQVVHGARPEQVPPLLRQIEEAGVRALGAMDRTVHMLRDGDGRLSAAGSGPDAPLADDAGARAAAYGLDDVPGVVERFRASGTADVRLADELPPERRADVPREVAATVHRVVVEALTNVRRHAPGAERVRVVLSCGGGGSRESAGSREDGLAGASLSVSVTDSGRGAAGARAGRPSAGERRSGLGLAGLAERVEALGGVLTAGGCGEGAGWEVRAEFPLRW
ncbi:sensor histidine kinase [Streptomyces mobaraensis]|uniref:histidine kinase n=1 Tax=Streptomyces mobaraensis TaxID=35621 RepID=A0A5N5W4R9_STRMB|nr:histidine kinase [Streptomyces mobaraensis]KAB7840007.1 two-component sensor histidine kinase [Streptomyces mobaraensis]